jgi:general secretion pathway protein D
VPFITGSEAREGDDPFQTIERQDVGITLKVKPRINRDNSVTLDIEQSVESVTESAEASDIITNKREIKTRVLIGNNETLVLGGLIRDEVEEAEKKVPFLGDIPVMGRLFKSTSTNTVKRNLMVFIHPTILAEADSGYELTRERYLDIQDRQRDFRKKIETYFVPGELPALPELDAEAKAADTESSQSSKDADGKDDE